MNIYLPMALAVEFKNFALIDFVGYGIAASFFVIFALYYNKKTRGENIATVRRREEYVEAHSELSPDYRDAILKGSLIVGMNEEFIIASVGHPKRTQILTVEPARSEVWIYRNGIYAHVHMGILQKWKVHHKFISFS
ncbi:MAG: hypothetical protein PF693_12220 [Spirochaetia bacterium]|jgi:hypothetical protein|nr:hypothetical protein [Spirochaetia bacterium]